MRTKEEVIQRYIVARLLTLEQEGYFLSFEADMGGRLGRSPGATERAKQLGWRPGTPDLTLFFPCGVVIRIELKARGGRLNPHQRKRHEILRKLGLKVEVVRAGTGADAWDQIVGIIWRHMPSVPIKEEQ